ncbi:MAG TPA: peptidoglycan-binding domain-containing protein [Candidatus Paceibacterota bacterium]|nr:peptidoglycan-binding domain-containing protein [Candidatus Paceibacterota bacterium]
MTTTPSILQKNLALIGVSSALFFVLSFSIASLAHAATITSQLDIGSTGPDVTTLQTYLSGNINWYPSGLITGYYGSLTEGGVEKFQTSEGIVSSGSPSTTGFGRVGPITLTHLNEIIGGNTRSSATVPVLSPVTITRGSNFATFSWTTDEPTMGQIYWDTASIRADEATGPGQTPYVSGTLVQDTQGRTTNHVVTVSNLQSNATYYYFMRSIDANGNISAIVPSSFQTTP